VGIQIIGNGGVIVGAGEEAGKSLHVTPKPIPASIGAYRTAVVLTMATTQAANSRLFEVRNTSTNLVIPTRIRVGIMAAGTITTAYAAQLALFRCTSFTAVDTANTVTPVASVKRTTGMTAYPGNAAVRHVTLAGAAAGMTGGSLVKDTQAVATAIAWVATAAATTMPIYQELLDDVNGTHPLVLAQNEGFEIENVIVGSGTANVVQVIIDVSWAEATAF
jgi:hypothetical protein